MHQYMDELQIKLNCIGEAIFQTYLFSPPLNVPEPEPGAEAKVEPEPEAEAKPEKAGEKSLQSQAQKQGKTTVAA